MKKIIPSLSKMWLKVINLEQSLFPKLQESIGSLSPKEENMIKILDFAEIEFGKNIDLVNFKYMNPLIKRKAIKDIIYV